MRRSKAPPEPKQLSEVEVTLTEKRFDDFCGACSAILSALRSDRGNRLTKQHVEHLNHKLWVKHWYTAPEDFKQTFREKYPEMFTPGPPITIPWTE